MGFPRCSCCCLNMGGIGTKMIVATEVPEVFRICSGAASGLGPWGYAVKRQDAAVLIDVPFFSQKLAQVLHQQAPEGVSHIFLTHDDFVSMSGHAEWKKAFPNAVRV